MAKNKIIPAMPPCDEDAIPPVVEEAVIMQPTLPPVVMRETEDLSPKAQFGKMANAKLKAF